MTEEIVIFCRELSCISGRIVCTFIEMQSYSSLFSSDSWPNEVSFLGNTSFLRIFLGIHFGGNSISVASKCSLPDIFHSNITGLPVGIFDFFD